MLAKEQEAMNARHLQQVQKKLSQGSKSAEREASSSSDSDSSDSEFEPMAKRLRSKRQVTSDVSADARSRVSERPA